MDWDTWFFEVWEESPDTAGTTPTHEDYVDYLNSRADDLRKEMKERASYL